VRVVSQKDSTGEGGRPTSHVSCKQTQWPAGAAAHAQQSGAGKLVKVVVGGKLHRERRTVNKHTGLRKQVQCHLSQCAWKGESL
jgi:hypothetical protein